MTSPTRYFLVRLLVVAGLTGPLFAEASDRDEIVAINRQVLTEVLVDNDGSALREYALDNFLVVAPGGRVETRDQALAGVESLRVKSVEITDEQMTSYGDTAVLVGRVVADGTMQPLGPLPPMKFMTTFVRTLDGWRILSRALVICAPIAIERGVC